jgi:hypothetical protein
MQSWFGANISFPELFVLDFIRQVSSDKTDVFRQRYIDPLRFLQTNEYVIDVTGLSERVLNKMMCFP